MKERAKGSPRIFYEALSKKAEVLFTNQDYEKSLYYYILGYGLLCKFVVKKIEKRSVVDYKTYLQLNDNSKLNIEFGFEQNQSYLDGKVVRSLTFECLLNLATCFIKMQNFKEAKDCLDEAAEIQPSSYRLYFLLSKAISYNCHYNIDEIQLANKYIKKLKSLLREDRLFKNSEKTLRRLKINNIEKSTNLLSKTIGKKKRNIEKWLKNKSHELVEKALKRYKNCSEETSIQGKRETQWEEIYQVLNLTHSDLVKNLSFYKKNRNKVFYTKYKKRFFKFNSFKAEVYEIKQIDVNLKILNPITKNKLISIYVCKEQKSIFKRLFEEEKIKEIIGMMRKTCIEENECKMAKSLYKSERLFVELSEQNYKKNRQIKIEAMFRILEFLVLAVFFFFVAKFLFVLTKI